STPPGQNPSTANCSVTPPAGTPSSVYVPFAFVPTLATIGSPSCASTQIPCTPTPLTAFVTLPVIVPPGTITASMPGIVAPVVTATTSDVACSILLLYHWVTKFDAAPPGQVPVELNSMSRLPGGAPSSVYVPSGFVAVAATNTGGWNTLSS